MADPTTDPSDAQIADDLQHATSAQPLKPYDIRGKDGLKGHVGAPGGVQHVADPTGWGLNSTGWVAVASLIVLAIMLWRKVPVIIARSLDARIDAIRTQLDEAARLRGEAEALRAEYAAKAASAHTDAETMLAHAHQEAHAIIAKAKTEAEALMGRRAKMAGDKIAGAERAAIAEVRARAADSAVRAATQLIAEHHDVGADRAMVNRAIGGLGRLN